MSRHHRGNWWRLARSAKIRAGFRCQRCQLPGRLQTHHRIPRWKGGTNEADNLIVLCGRCHGMAHRRLGQPGATRARDPDGGATGEQPRRGLSEEWRDLVRELRDG